MSEVSTNKDTDRSAPSTDSYPKYGWGGECDHELVDDSTHEERLRGWHPAHCKHCGRNMSYDSGG